MQPCIGVSSRWAAVLWLASLLLLSSQVFAQGFMRFPGQARMLLIEDGTEKCLYANRDDVVLRECASGRDRNQIWEIRKDFTIYNEGRGKCLFGGNPNDLQLRACNFAAPNQQWWMLRNSLERYEIQQLNDMSQCVGTIDRSSGKASAYPKTALGIQACDSQTALSFDFDIPGTVPRRTGGLLPPTTGTLKNIREIAPEGFNSLFNKYSWSMAQNGDSIVIGTLNLRDQKALYLYTEGVAVDSQGAEIWEGATSDGGRTWQWSPMFKGGLFDPNNIGVRKIINCGDQLLGVYMNNVSGFGLLRYDGSEWTVEFKDGGPGRLADPRNVSARGMAVYDRHVYLGVHGAESGASIWRRKIDRACDWTPGSRWEVITNNGFGVDGSGIDPINKNSWFGDMTEFQGRLYVGTLNWAGAQIWRSETGDRGTWEQVYRAPVVRVSARNTNIFKLIEFQDHLVASTENGFLGAELLVTPSGDPGTWETPYPRAMTGDRRDNYGWFIGEAFGRLYPFFKSDVQGYRTFAISDITTGGFATESMQAFNTPRLYFGGRTSIEYDPQERGDRKLLILGSTTPNNDQGTRVYAAENNRGNRDHVILKGQLPTTEGPRECIRTRDMQTGTLLNNGVAWVNFSAFGALEIVRQSGAVESTETEGTLNRTLCFHENGNLVIYGPGGRMLWQSHTRGTGVGMKLTRKCDFIIFDESGQTVYSADTDCDGRMPPS